MPHRSQLMDHIAAISEAREAGTSIDNLALTYGVGYSTMYMFIGRHLPDIASPAARSNVDRENARLLAYHHARFADDPEYRSSRRARWHAYNHSFAGVARHYRYADRTALGRLEDQVKEAMSQL